MVLDNGAFFGMIVASSRRCSPRAVERSRMASKRITVLARVRAKEGLEDRVREVLLGLVAPTRAEAGCLNYDLHQSIEDKTLFMFYENWVSLDALNQHLESPHINDAEEKLAGLLAEPADIKTWELISPP
jgi:quinol monooxygenase YgiN